MRSLLLMLACAPEPPPLVPGSASPEPPATRHVVEVHVRPAIVWSTLPQRAEIGGLVTGLFEMGLSDLVDVAPEVDGVPPSPGLADRLQTHVEPWTAKLAVTPGEGSGRPGDPASRPLRVGVLLCNPSGGCVNFERPGTRGTLAETMGGLLSDVAHPLGRAPSPAVATRWAGPLSTDPYAQLMCGRSGSIFYGLRDPVDLAVRFDRRADPVAKAVYLDPKMSLGWWFVGRLHASLGNLELAREAFTLGVSAHPDGAVLRADEAVAYGRLEKWDTAWARWREVEALVPGDPRFAVPRARAALKAEKVKEALAILDSLPEAFQSERSVAELRVAIAEATGRSSNYDELLARWQDAAPSDPEPVRRRVALRIDDGRWEEALALTDELKARGAGDEATRQAMALAVGLERYADAAAQARALGLEDEAARIEARGAMAEDPQAVPAIVAASTEPSLLVAAGEALLRGRDPEAALAKADAALAQRPWFAEAHALRARALDALGDAESAAAARRTLRQVDPAWRG
jgi:tetratricopeptide (TPR) repeat protein